MEFQVVSQFLESLKGAKNTTEKFSLAESFIKRIKNQFCLKEPEPQQKLFLVLRLLVPKLDRDRPAYNIKESKIARIVTKMLCLSQGDDRNTLIRATGSSFPQVVFTILRKHISNFQSNLKVEELNDYLDKIANREADTGLDELMLEMFRKASPQDVKWIVHIILKDMKLGIDANRILNAFHKDGAAYYSSNSNLKKVCEVLWNSEVRINELQIAIFEAFHPMLSKRCDVDSFKKDIIDGNLYLIENKFDGERFQIHMSDERFKYFSRRGFDFTDMYGSTFNDGMLSPLLKECFDSTIKRIILDGEMMLWNKQTKKFGSKGMSSDVKHLTSTGRYQPCFCVFDILLLNDKVLTNQPLTYRLKILRKVLKKTIDGTLIISKYAEVRSRQDVVNALNDAVDREEEGIVVKEPTSVYKFGDRNSGWYKMKLEYFDDAVHDLDLLLMGASYGSHKKFVSFYVGIRSGNNDQGNIQFLSLGRVGSGLNDLEVDMITQRLNTKGHGIKSFDSLSKGSLCFGKDVPNVWIEPKDSYVLVVRATELIKATTSDFRTPYTLRFPRILKVRDDKPVEDVLTINEILNLASQYTTVVKLSKRYLELDEILKAKSKAPKKVQHIESATDLKSGTFSFLDNYTFFVYSLDDKMTAGELDNSVRDCRGFVTIKMDPEVDVVLVGKEDGELPQFIHNYKSDFDIISLKWLYRVLETKTLLPYKQEEIISLRDTETYLSDTFDRWGDSFIQPTTVKSLKRTFQLISQKEDFPFVKKKPKSFESKVAYFDNYEIINDNTSTKIYESFLDEMEFRFRGGTIARALNLEVHFVIVGTNDRKEVVKSYISELNVDCQIVNKSFLYEN